MRDDACCWTKKRWWRPPTRPASASLLRRWSATSRITACRKNPEILSDPCHPCRSAVPLLLFVSMRDNPYMPTSSGALRVGVIGVGAFGRNHARVYHDLQSDSSLNVQLVGVVDSDFARALTVAREFATSAFRSIDELIQVGVQAVSAAVPTAAHLEVARQLMQKGVDVLIEKPLTANLAEADEMIGLAERYGCIAQTGHLERFNPAVRATLPLLTQPMFFEVHRLSIFTPRSLDVDVVLDLMIHDIDIVL